MMRALQWMQARINPSRYKVLAPSRLADVRIQTDKLSLG